MGEPIAVMALMRKRDLISGTIAKYEKLILAAQHDLAHVNSALRLFEVTGEGPLDTRELTQRVMVAKDLDASDKVLGQAIALRVVQTLRMRAKRRKIDGTLRRRGVCVWALPTSLASAPKKT